MLKKYNELNVGDVVRYEGKEALITQISETRDNAFLSIGIGTREIFILRSKTEETIEVLSRDTKEDKPINKERRQIGYLRCDCDREKGFIHYVGQCVKNTPVYEDQIIEVLSSKSEKKEEWKPKKGEQYYSIYVCQGRFDIEYITLYYPENIVGDNFFHTKAEAEEALEKVKELLLSLKK